MTLRKTFLLVAIGVCYVSSSVPATLRTVDVSRRQDRYRVVADTHLDASPESVYKVLLDFDNDRYQRISEIYKESSYLPPDSDGTPLVYTRGQCVPLSDTPGWTLGYPVDNPEYRTERIPMTHGMRFLLFTDGLSEAARGPDPEHHTFGMGGLVSLFQSLCEQGREPLAAALFAAVEEYRAGWPQDDDATALVVAVR